MALLQLGLGIIGVVTIKKKIYWASSDSLYSVRVVMFLVSGLQEAVTLECKQWAYILIIEKANTYILGYRHRSSLPRISQVIVVSTARVRETS